MMRILLLSIFAGLAFAQSQRPTSTCSPEGVDACLNRDVPGEDEDYIQYTPGAGCRRYANCNNGFCVGESYCLGATFYDRESARCVYEIRNCPVGEPNSQENPNTQECNRKRPTNLRNENDSYLVSFDRDCAKFIWCGRAGALGVGDCPGGTIFQDANDNDPDSIGACVDGRSDICEPTRQ